jgi:hypothetical protein
VWLANRKSDSAEDDPCTPVPAIGDNDTNSLDPVKIGSLDPVKIGSLDPVKIGGAGDKQLAGRPQS